MSSVGTIDRSLQQAADCFNSGDDARAETLCRQALQLSPRHPHALHLLGVIALQRGDFATAVELLRQAVAIEPGHPDFQASLAYGYVGLRRLPEALAAFETAARLNPRDPELQLGVGNCLAMMGRSAAAETVFRRLIERHPQHALGWFNLANAVRDQDRHQEARDIYARVTQMAPRFAGAHLGLGAALLKLGQPAAALDSFRKSEALEPGNPELQLAHGLSLLELDRLDEAIVRFERALSLNPDYAEGHLNLGNAHFELEQFDKAEKCYERAVALDPGDARAHNNLGNVRRKRGDYAQALVHYHQALSVSPNYAMALYNLGVVHHQQGRVPEGIAWYEKALARMPEYPEARYDLALAQLKLGNLQRGWENYEWRFRQDHLHAPVEVRAFPYPEWRGEPLAGKRILVWGEQGVGDELIFACMYPEVAAAAEYCVIECAAKLVPLLARSVPGATLVAKDYPPHELTRSGFDYQAPAGDLCRWLRPTLASFPRHRGYLVPPVERVAYWKERLAALGAGPKIGFSWRSSLLTGSRAQSCTTLEQWGPIFSVPGVHFINLQYDECAAELAQARQQFNVPLHAFAEVDLFNDLDEAAALTRAVDLVISAPTTVSVLSAALGVPTWQMTFGIDWQRLGTDSNPWYPAMTLFERAYAQGWEEIIREIAARLKQYTGGAPVTRPARESLSP